MHIAARRKAAPTEAQTAGRNSICRHELEPGAQLIPTVLRQTSTLAAVGALTLGVGALCLFAGHSLVIAASVAVATAVVSLCILLGGR